MKSYTDLEQSKKLAEILSIESADMCFNISQRYNMPPLMTPYSKFNEFFNMEKTPDFLIPCWSLVALLSVLPKYIGGSVLRMDMSEDDFNLWFDDFSGIVDEILPDITKDNPIDACYEMIIKLNEQNIL